MHGKVKFIVASFCLLPFFVLSEAYGNCRYFFVHFDNQTPFNCNVMHSKLHHGYWITPWITPRIKGLQKKGYLPPHAISFLYQAKQSAVYGPDAEVTLGCGNKVKGYYKFTVRNQQDFCYLAGGDQTNTVVSQDKGIKVTNVMRHPASYLGDKPGIARVTVKLSS